MNSPSRRGFPLPFALPSKNILMKPTQAQAKQVPMQNIATMMPRKESEKAEQSLAHVAITGSCPSVARTSWTSELPVEWQVYCTSKSRGESALSIFGTDSMILESQRAESKHLT